MTNPNSEQGSANEANDARTAVASNGNGMPSAATIRKRIFSRPTLIAALIGAALLGFALWRVFDFEWDAFRARPHAHQ